MVSKAQVQNANGPGMGRRGRHPVRGQRGCGDRRRSEQMQAGRSQDSLCSGHMQWVAQRPGSWTSPTSSCPFTPNRVCDARRCPGALLLRLPETKPSQLHWGPCPERPVDPWTRPPSWVGDCVRTWHAPRPPLEHAALLSGVHVPCHCSAYSAKWHHCQVTHSNSGGCCGSPGPACPRAPRQSGACGGPLAPSPSGLPWTVGPVPLSPVLAAVQTRTCSLAGHRRLVGARPASHTAKPPGRMPHEHACV